MTSIAARARAAKIAAEAEAAQAEADKAQARKSAPAIARPNHPDVPAPAIRVQSARTSPAARRKSFLIAASASGVLVASGIALDLSAGNDNREMASEAAQILLQLQEDQRRLKDISSIERKIAAKRLLLPNYEAWCAGVLAGGRGQRSPLDEVFTTMMAWRIDVGDFVEAMPMVEHAALYGLEMPERFDRGVVAFAVEQISEAAIAAYDKPIEGAPEFPGAVLPQLRDLIDVLDADLHDEIQAKLHRALGLAVMAGANLEDEEDLRERQEQTLRCYERAYQLNPKVGVKKHIDALNKSLKKTAAPDTSDETAPETPPDTPAQGG